MTETRAPVPGDVALRILASELGAHAVAALLASRTPAPAGSAPLYIVVARAPSRDLWGAILAKPDTGVVERFPLPPEVADLAQQVLGLLLRGEPEPPPAGRELAALRYCPQLAVLEAGYRLTPRSFLPIRTVDVTRAPLGEPERAN